MIMRVISLKKTYSKINPSQKNIKWRPVTKEYMDDSINLPQFTCNCFFNATKNALYNSQKGREILNKRIKSAMNCNKNFVYKVIFNIDGVDKPFRVNEKDMYNKFFDVYLRYVEVIPGCLDFNSLPAKLLNCALDIAVSKMIKKYPKQKPWYLKMYGWPENERYEFNKPSNAFQWLTGIKPVKYGEDGYDCNLKKNKAEILELFRTLGKSSSKDYSFVLMSGSKFTPETKKWHCVTITKVDDKNKRVYYIDRRKNTTHDVSYDTVFNNFKAIIGINWKDKK